MATLSISQKAALDNLLAKGELAEAQKFLEGLAGNQPAAPDASSEPAPPPEPRKPESVMLDIVKAIYSLLGSNPLLTDLVKELEAVLTPTATPPAA